MGRLSVIVMLAGWPSLALARPDVASSEDLFPVHQIGHLYINLKTGERVMTPYDDRSGPDLWNNDDNAVCGNFFYGIDRPTRPTTDPRPRFGASVNSVGEFHGHLGVGTTIDGFGIGFASTGIKSTNTTVHECAGLDLLVFLYENDDGNGGMPDPRAQLAFSETISDIPGAEGTGNGWTFSIDLAGGNEFVLGDQDLDGDRNLDIGWGFAMVQGQSLTDGINSAKGVCGPYLVAPGGFVNELGVASTSTSIGVANRLHWYSPVTFDSSGLPQDRSHQSFIGSYDFGVPSSSNPYASTYLVLQGPCVACYADFNGDCFVDFTDFDDFVSAFEAGDPSADYNQDGFLDFTDFDDAVAAFESGC